VQQHDAAFFGFLVAVGQFGQIAGGGILVAAGDFLAGATLTASLGMSGGGWGLAFKSTVLPGGRFLGVPASTAAGSLSLSGTQSLVAGKRGIVRRKGASVQRASGAQANPGGPAVEKTRVSFM
jgi:hypothetical protein